MLYKAEHFTYTLFTINVIYCMAIYKLIPYVRVGSNVPVIGEAIALLLGAKGLHMVKWRLIFGGGCPFGQIEGAMLFCYEALPPYSL